MKQDHGALKKSHGLFPSLPEGRRFFAPVPGTCLTHPNFVDNIVDMADFAEFNAVYEKYFVNKPARSCVAVKDLPKGVKVEVEVIAEIK